MKKYFIVIAAIIGVEMFADKNAYTGVLLIAGGIYLFTGAIKEIKRLQHGK